MSKVKVIGTYPLQGGDTMSEVKITGLYPTTFGKMVQAYGLTIDVPLNTRYLTIDLNGRLTAWKQLPEKGVSDYLGWTRRSESEMTENMYGTLLCYVRYSGRWEDSLISLE